jgi:hypothetical protein
MAASRLTAHAEALAAFYETRAVLYGASARDELARPDDRHAQQPRWAAQAQHYAGLYREVQSLAPRGAAPAENTSEGDDHASSYHILADDVVRFAPKPAEPRRYENVPMQPRLELLFEEALVPHRDRDLFLSEWCRGRVDERALADQIKGLLGRRTHLREILAALREARARQPAALPVEAPPIKLVATTVDAPRVAGVVDPSQCFFPRAPPLPACVPLNRKPRRLGVSAKFTCLRLSRYTRAAPSRYSVRVSQVALPLALLRVLSATHNTTTHNTLEQLSKQCSDAHRQPPVPAKQVQKRCPEWPSLPRN